MKKHLHKILAGLLVATTMLSVTGCTTNKNEGQSTTQGGENKNVAMGRYVEEDLEIPQELTSIIEFIKHEDGSVEVYGMADDKTMSYTLGSDGKWSKTSVEWIKTLNNDGNRLDKIAYSAEGTLYILYTDTAYEPHIAKVTQEGNLEEIKLELGDLSGYIMDIAVLENGDLLVGRQNIGVTRFDGETGKSKQQYDGYIGEIAVSNERLMMIEIEKQALIAYDLETGEEVETIECEGIDWDSKVIFDEDGGLYLINTKGISHLAPGGSVWETIIEGAMCSLGMPSLYMKEIKMTGKDEFIAVFGGTNEDNQLVKYSYHADVPTRPTTQVNVYMLEENMTMRQAAAEYQRNNPGVFVNLEIGMSGGDGITKADAIRTLNTELLAGKGPDILILDGLPIESYIEKGVLLDMGEWANSKISSGEWMENITKAYEKEGGIYALPTRFTLPTMWGNQEIIDSVDTIEELAEWAEQHPEQNVLYPMTPQELIKKSYGTSAMAWLDEKGQINQEGLVQYLEAINRLADTEAEVEDPNDAGKLEAKSVEYLAYKDISLHLQNMNGFTNLMLPYSAMIQNGNAAFDLTVSSQEGIFEPVGIMGINANSKNQDIIKDIVMTALSEKVQEVEFGDGFAVNSAAFEKQADLSSGGGMMMSFAMSAAGARQIDMKQPDQKNYDQLAKLAKAVSIPTQTDDVLLQMIIDGTKGYFDGEKTAEEAAAAVAEQTRAYLAE